LTEKKLLQLLLLQLKLARWTLTVCCVSDACWQQAD